MIWAKDPISFSSSPVLLKAASHLSDVSVGVLGHALGGAVQLGDIFLVLGLVVCLLWHVLVLRP